MRSQNHRILIKEAKGWREELFSKYICTVLMKKPRDRVLLCVEN